MSTTQIASTGTQFGNYSEKNNLGHITTNLTNITTSTSTHLDPMLTPRPEITGNMTETGLNSATDMLFTTLSIQEPMYSNNNSEGIFTTENTSASAQYGNNSENSTLDYITTSSPITTENKSTYLDSTVTLREKITANITETGLYSEKDMSFTAPSMRKPMDLKNNTEGISTTEIASTGTQFGNYSEKNNLHHITTNLTNITTSTSTHLDPMLTLRPEITGNMTETGLNSATDMLFTTLSIQEPMYSHNNSEGIFTTENTSASAQYGNNSENSTLDYITTSSPITTENKSTYLDSTVALREKITANITETGLYSEKDMSFTAPSMRKPMDLKNNTEGISTTEIASTGTQFRSNSENNNLDYITTNLTNITTSTSTHLDSMLTPRLEITGNMTETGLNPEKNLLFTTSSIQEPIYSNNNSEGISTINITTADIQFGNTSEKRTLDYTTTSPPIMTETKSTYLNSTVTLSGKITANITEARLNSEQDMPFTAPSMRKPINLNNNTEGMSTTQIASTGTQFGNYSEKNNLGHITTNLTNITTSTSTHLDPMLTPRPEITGNMTETGLNSATDMLFTTLSIQEPMYSNNNSEGIFTTENTSASAQYGNNSENSTLDYITTSSPITTENKSKYLDSTVTLREKITANITETGLFSEKNMSFTASSMQKPMDLNKNTEGISTTEIASTGTQFGNNSEKNNLDRITTNLTNITTSTSTHLDPMLTPRPEITGNMTETGLNSATDMLFTTLSIQEPMYSNNNSEGIFTTENTSASAQYGNNSENSTLDYITTSSPITTENKSKYLDSTVTLREKITANITETGLYSEKNMSFTASSMLKPMDLNNNTEGISTTEIASTGTQFRSNSENNNLDYIITNMTTSKDSRTVSTDESSRSDSSNKSDTGNKSETSNNSDTSLNSSKEKKTKSDERYKKDNAKTTGKNENTSGDSSAAEFRCVKEGKFPDYSDCTKYYECKRRNESLRRKRRKCDKGEVFHKQKKKCVDADSHEYFLSVTTECNETKLDRIEPVGVRTRTEVGYRTQIATASELEMN
ncbi:hypothetical protein EVAR_33973_1 [Eumeta japonica]|uniref:Chitin-binding type-2 domain-containing protein n=1 Tax=Eumeta variegata TaxID=151549 RepID=A0A4C1X3P7_EUMVA|nr:hypothetical protein EVAR_33973_1 [Eumeta japonica]